MALNRRTVARRQQRGNRFAETPSVGVPRSTFDLSYTHKTTFQGANLVPVYCSEVLPGDTYNLRAQFFGRMATPIYPVMDNSFLDIFWSSADIWGFLRSSRISRIRAFRSGLTR